MTKNRKTNDKILKYFSILSCTLLPKIFKTKVTIKNLLPLPRIDAKSKVRNIKYSSCLWQALYTESV
jgi:hypothetical protein